MTTQSEANGRVNIIGEHTDYNDGFVLPTCIPQKTSLKLSRRSDDRGIVHSSQFADSGTFSYRIGEEKNERHWADYIQGISFLLQTKGIRLPGFEMTIHSTVPLGSGLSSSASLLVAAFRAFRAEFAFPWNDLEIALMSQAVENNFIGARVGIMDPMATSLGEPGSALFIDTRTLDYRRIPLPLKEHELFVINSGIKHSHATGGYNTRRGECEAACQQLDVTTLRDITDTQRLAKLSPILKKRARHVVTENQRVLAAVSAIEHGDLGTLGALMWDSHLSMRDDYEVSVPEVDFLVEQAMALPQVLGARLTGGGFGGSIVGICEKGMPAKEFERIGEAFQKRFGHPPTYFRI